MTTEDGEPLVAKAAAERDKAYQEELRRLEDTASSGSQKLLAQWLASEEKLRRDASFSVRDEAAKVERTLRSREQEYLRQIEEEERRKKDEGARRLQDERRRREEADRRKREEEEKQRKLEEERVLREIETPVRKPLSRKDIEQRERSSLHLTQAEIHLKYLNFDDALLEIAKAFVYTPDLPEATALRTRIQQAQKTALVGAREEESSITSDEEAQEERKRKSRISSKYYAYGAVVIVAFLVAIVLFHNRHAIFAKDISLAVMPWSLAASGDTLNLLASELPELINIRLGELPSVHLLGYETALSLARSGGQGPGELGYATILSGTIAQHGENFEIKVTLADTAGKQIWTNTITSGYDGLAGSTDQIVRGVLTALEMAPADTSLPPAPMRSLALFDYLEGNRSRHAHSDDIRSSIEMFQRATTADSKSAEAAAGYASTVVSLAEQKHGGARILDEAESAARNALAIDSTFAESHVALGRVNLLKGNCADALAEFTTASHLSPGSSGAYLGLGLVAVETGDFDKGVDALQHGLKIDPRNPDLLRVAAYASQLKGSTKEGAAYLETEMTVMGDSVAILSGPLAEMMMVDPDLTLSYGDRVTAILKQLIAAQSRDFDSGYRLGRLEQVSGKAQEASSLLSGVETAVRDDLRRHANDGLLMATLARVLTRIGKYAEAQKYATQALQASGNDPAVLYKAAQMYSVQMFAGKSGGTADSVMRSNALTNLQKAVKLDYRIDEICNADFFNLHGDAEFTKSIQLPGR